MRSAKMAKKMILRHQTVSIAGEATASAVCPIADFDISSIKSSDSAVRLQI
jgi:hypothetical protein